jgi:Porin subfamily.
VNQATYTAQFGNGVSGSVSVQDPTIQDTTNVWNTSYATAAGLITGAYGTNSFGQHALPTSSATLLSIRLGVSSSCRLSRTIRT